MKDPKPHDVAEIESLLATRQQLSEWLARLEEAGARAPETVRAKVRADYQGRLAQVVAQLATHRDVISSTLDGLRSQSQEFVQLRADELEVRSEAELRHAVGEYTDEEWQLVQVESSGKIAGFDHEIERLTQEIQRLAEVQALVAEPEPAPPPSRPERISASAPPAPRLVSEPISEEETPREPPPPQPRPEAPRFVPRSGHYSTRESLAPRPAPPSPRPAPITQAPTASGDDELTFLRSVNVEIEPSGRTELPATEPPGEFRPGQPSLKTLKCGECGSLNRPTEWYCERCGAELAAV